MIGEITTWIMSMMQTHGATTVVVGVLIESIIVPIPSPLIIMGAGSILIEPTLSAGAAFMPILTKIVLPGAFASTVGAYFTYLVAYWGGKPAVERYSRFLGFDWKMVLAMEEKLKGRVALMIFLLRALPIVPLSLISGAVGVLRLSAVQFGLWTFLGSLPRCLILAYLGFMTRGAYEMLAGHINKIESLVSVSILVGAFALIFWLRSRMRKDI
jgi:membrane protein DedA with SNARE-associated domain